MRSGVRSGFAMSLVPGHWSFAPIPIDLHVMRRPADGHDVGPAVAVQVARHQILNGDAARIDDLPRPLAGSRVAWVVNPDAALRRFAGIVADADHQLVILVAVEVRARDGMAPLQIFVEHRAGPE